MNRKDFLSTLIPAGIVLSSAGGQAAAGTPQKKQKIKVPPYLKEGDTIGITCPAGYISEEDVRPAAQLMESWGFTIRLGNTVGKRDFSMGGTDEERRTDFQQMLDAPDVKAIMCARGGYGSLRIIDSLSFGRFQSHPKWIIGFSDITVLHCHVNRNFGIASIHSKMCNSFPSDWTKADTVQMETILSIRQALSGETMRYTVPAMPANRTGIAGGVLVGGNLRTIENLAGSRSDLDTRGKILFIEDTGEYLYSIDRMFLNLKRSGKLSGLKGLIVGGFKIKPDDPDEEFGKTIYDIVMEKVSSYSYPVCFDFPVGHQKNNFALKCGIKHVLDVKAEGVTLISQDRWKAAG